MIILTGVSGGIGLNVIKNLCKIDGVIGIYFNNKPKIKLKNLKLCKVDLSKESEIKKFINSNVLKEKKITIIHMASIKIDKIIINHSYKDLKKTFDVNFFAPFIFSKLLIPIMIKNNFGRIIFLSSTGGLHGDIGTSIYTSTKRAISGFSKVISLEYGGFNITSNIIKLGNFGTGMFKDLSKAKQKELINQIPSKKLGNFKDINSAIKFIITSDYINGAEINIDGGMKR